MSKRTTKALVLIIVALFSLTIVNVHAEVSSGLSSRPVFKAIAGEHYHFLALDETGRVWEWGTNMTGKIDSNPDPYWGNPRLISNLQSIVAISSGYEHSSAVQADGTLWKWGVNSFGELGAAPDKVEESAIPVKITGIDHVVSVSDSAFYTLALKEDGTVWSWGRNDEGQLGQGTTGKMVTTPQQIKGLTNIAFVYAGWNIGYAVGEDGTVWRWGNIPVCDSETCTFKMVKTPQRFESIQDVSAISDGTALKKDGTVWSWGFNVWGSLGLGDMNEGYLSDPVQIKELKNIAVISKTKAVSADGQIWVWGRNDYGQAGDNTKNHHPSPFRLTEPDQVIDISSGEEITVALTKDGTLWTWGQNKNGEIKNTAQTIMPPIKLPLEQEDQDVNQQVVYHLPIPRDPGSWTFLDPHKNVIKNGRIYYMARPFSEGLAAILLAWNSKWGFIGTNGDVVIPYKYDVSKDFHEGMAAVKKGTVWGFVNKVGTEVIPPTYKNVDSFHEGMAGVQINNRWGFMNAKGTITIPAKYEEILPFSEGLAAVKINSKWGFINKQGKLTISPQFASAGSFMKGLAPVRQNGKWGYIRPSGKWAIAKQFDSAMDFSSDNLAAVGKAGKWGFINLQGKLEIAYRFDKASAFSEGISAVQKSGNWALINKKGALLTSFQFKKIDSFSGGLAWAATDTDNGYIDLSGKWYYKQPIMKW